MNQASKHISKAPVSHAHVVVVVLNAHVSLDRLCFGFIINLLILLRLKYIVQHLNMSNIILAGGFYHMQ